MADDTVSSESDNIRIASTFLLHSPPGEFNEVFNDVRMLLNNDSLLKDGCAAAFAQYNKEQFMPVKVEGEADRYIEGHYEETGIAAVFVNNDALTLCIESHRYQPKNFWNGRWRSQWAVPFADGKTEQREIKGIIKVHVHYYEDGNVQLVSSKEITAKVTFSADFSQAAKDVLKTIWDEEAKYQADFSQAAKDVLKTIWDEEAKYQDAVQENYQQMSSTTFKALRRQLPVTGVKFDWNNAHAYRIGKDLKPQ
ncbi:unnamed protein product [Gongylonema pulchrum]|uniref:F-actin-capping protein subunit alpha n=1 Tax=Gongylonema pulchrum TaxID=637853 RepID=A0A183E0V7_9BILA|nr:unnamed protein product [Gongylonema pulchrum]